MTYPNVEIVESDRMVVAALKGTIGVVEVDRLDAALGAIADKKPRLVVLDLSQLSMMGSSAMGSLVGFRRDIGKAGGVCRMAGVSPVVRESFKRALLDKLFKLYDTVDAAAADPLA